MKLRGLDGERPTPTDLSRLIADSVASPGGEWALNVDARVAALSSFVSREALRRALETNAPRPTDPLQRALDALIVGPLSSTDAPLDADVPEILEASEWLRAAKIPGLELPDSEALHRRAARIALLRPLRRIVGAHFRGRDRELAEIKHLVVGPPADPLMFHGVGGLGKSVLLAKAALELLEAGTALVVRLDFDRPTLVPDRPRSLLRELVDQLGPQLPSSASRDALESIVEEIAGPADEYLKTQVALKYFANWLGRDTRPTLLVLDTLEEVQHRGKVQVEGLWELLGQLRDMIPMLRVVLGGRSLLPDRAVTSWPLLELERPAAIDCLEALGVSREAAVAVQRLIGGSPLALRLVAALLEREPLPQVTEALSGAEFEARVRAHLREGFVVRRIIGHIHDERVKAIASPSLALRRITPELLDRVLAPACGLDLQAGDAERLFVELARETSLVVVDPGASVLRYRPELRPQLLRLLAPEDLDAVHRRAVLYYEKLAGTESRAEELYHRLCLDESASTLDDRWTVGVAAYLRGAVDELPQNARAYVASRGDDGGGLEALSLDNAFWRDADLRLWERKAEQWVRDLLRKDQNESALKYLQQRSERLPGSPLLLLEAEALLNMGSLDRARSVLQKALAESTRGPSDRVTALLLLTRTEERARREAAARRAIREARDTHAELGLSQRLELRAGVTRLLSEYAPVDRDMLARELEGASTRDLRGIAAVARRAVAEIVEAQPKLASRVLHAIGFGSVGGDAFESLFPDVTPEPGLPDGPEKLVAVLASSPSNELRRRIAAVLREDKDEAVRRAIEFRSAQAAGSQAELHAQIAQALAKTLTRDQIRGVAGPFRVFISFEEPVRDSVARLIDMARRQEKVGALLDAALALVPQSAELAALRTSYERRARHVSALRLTATELEKLAVSLEPGWHEAAFVDEVLADLNTPRPTGRGLDLLSLINDQGRIGLFLALARAASPANPKIYVLGQGAGLTAMRPDDDRQIRETFRGIEIDAFRSRLGVLETQMAVVHAGPTRLNGFLVGPDLVLTSGLVLGLLGEAMHAEFDSTLLVDGTQPRPGRVVGFASDPIVAHEGDGSSYLLMRLLERIGDEPIVTGGPPRGWVRRIGSPDELPPDAPLATLSCDDRGPLRFSFASRGLTSSQPERIEYRSSAHSDWAGALIVDRDLNAIGVQTHLGGEQQRAAYRLDVMVERLRRKGILLDVEIQHAVRRGDAGISRGASLRRTIAMSNGNGTLGRLKRFNETIRAGDPKLAEEVRDTASLESLDSASTPGAELELESIVLKKSRPVLAIKNSETVLVFKKEEESEIWKERLRKATTLLSTAIRAVGRIELEGHEGLGWVGTGWLIADDVVVTNRHVALEFAARDGEGFVFKPGTSGTMSAAVDFLQEFENPDKLPFKLTRPLHVEEAPGPDLAFFAVESQSTSGAKTATPIKLSAQPRLTPNVAVIGYPAWDSRIPDAELMSAIFGDVYNKKRLAPGGVTKLEDVRLWHDCSTLGGNSGSAVLDLETGEAIGLHFSGCFLKTNYAVRSDFVARRLQDLRNGSLPAPREPAPPRLRSQPSPGQVARPVSVNESPRHLSLNLPLPISITLNGPTITIDSPTRDSARKQSAAMPTPSESRGDAAEISEARSAETYADRTGFAEDFLGEGARVALPRVVRHARDVLSFVDPANGQEEIVLRYEHFSVVMSRSRRMCFFSAANIDGARSKKIAREPWRWDDRIPRELQIMKECYGNAPKFSRGHMTRREDPVWGDTASATKGNRDSMHVTNTTPQMQPFNAPIWLGLEDYALDNARKDTMQVCVMTGPYFTDGDPEKFGVRIPVRFWKVIAFIHDRTKRLSATGYEMSQENQLEQPEYVFGGYYSPQLKEQTQVPIRSIERQSGLSFGGLADHDPLDGDEAVGDGGTLLMDFNQIRF
jgi:endonuclease G